MPKFKGDKRKKRLRQYRARERKRMAKRRADDLPWFWYWNGKIMRRLWRLVMDSTADRMASRLQQQIIGLTEQ